MRTIGGPGDRGELLDLISFFLLTKVVKYVKTLNFSKKNLLFQVTFYKNFHKVKVIFCIRKISLKIF